MEGSRGLSRSYEGLLFSGFVGPEEASSIHVGEPVECFRRGLLYSVYICAGPGGFVAVKDYRVSSLKWIPAFIAAAPTVRYRRDPKLRALSELYYSRLLRMVVNTPRILSAHLWERGALTVREYVPGVSVLDSRDPRAWRMAGKALARIHSEGYALGDANPGNFIVSGSSITLVDMEQVRPSDPTSIAWDIITVIAYTHLTRAKGTYLNELIETYVGEGAPTREAIRELGKLKYWTPYLLMPHKIVEALKITANLNR